MLGVNGILPSAGISIVLFVSHLLINETDYLAIISVPFIYYGQHLLTLELTSVKIFLLFINKCKGK